MDEKDINCVFDDIVFSEEKIASAAFEEGYEKGKDDGLKEGYHLGYHRGAEVGYELGFIEGVILSLKPSSYLENAPSRVLTTMSKLENLLSEVPVNNAEDCDIISTINEIRTLFKQLMSLLKLTIVPPPVLGDNF